MQARTPHRKNHTRMHRQLACMHAGAQDGSFSYPADGADFKYLLELRAEAGARGRCCAWAAACLLRCVGHSNRRIEPTYLNQGTADVLSLQSLYAPASCCRVLLPGRAGGADRPLPGAPAQSLQLRMRRACHAWASLLRSPSSHTSTS